MGLTFDVSVTHLTRGSWDDGETSPWRRRRRATASGTRRRCSAARGGTGETVTPAYLRRYLDELCLTSIEALLRARVRPQTSKQPPLPWIKTRHVETPNSLRTRSDSAARACQRRPFVRAVPCLCAKAFKRRPFGSGVFASSS